MVVFFSTLGMTLTNNMNPLHKVKGFLHLFTGFQGSPCGLQGVNKCIHVPIFLYLLLVIGSFKYLLHIKHSLHMGVKFCYSSNFTHQSMK